MCFGMRLLAALTVTVASVSAQDLSGQCSLRGTTPDAAVTVNCPADWQRSEWREGDYIQVNFRRPGGSATNLNLQYFKLADVVNLWNGTAVMHLDLDGFVKETRNEFREVGGISEQTTLAAPNGTWILFSVDVSDPERLAYKAARLGNLFPVEHISEPDPSSQDRSLRQIIFSRMGQFANTRHSYAVRGTANGFIVLIYAAPIQGVNPDFLAAVVQSADFDPAKAAANAAIAPALVASSEETDDDCDALCAGLRKVVEHRSGRFSAIRRADDSSTVLLPGAEWCSVVHAYTCRWDFGTDIAAARNTFNQLADAVEDAAPSSWQLTADNAQEFSAEVQYSADGQPGTVELRLWDDEFHQEEERPREFIITLRVQPAYRN